MKLAVQFNGSQLHREALPIFHTTASLVPGHPQSRNLNREQLAELRAAAILGLGNYGKDARQDLDNLRAMKFKDESEIVRRLTGEAVTKIESELGK